jgi:hypothetical protein
MARVPDVTAVTVITPVVTAIDAVTTAFPGALEIAVVLITAVSSRFSPPAALTTANSGVPKTFSASKIKREACPLAVPSVAPAGTVRLSCDATETVSIAPLVSVALRKSIEHGSSVRVIALDAADAPITGGDSLPKVAPLGVAKSNFVPLPKFTRLPPFEDAVTLVRVTVVEVARVPVHRSQSPVGVPFESTAMVIRSKDSPTA